jgi:hypothetical protein
VYYDDSAGRRVVNGTMSEEQALSAAQGYLAQQRTAQSGGGDADATLDIPQCSNPGDDPG